MTLEQSVSIEWYESQMTDEELAEAMNSKKGYMEFLVDKYKEKLKDGYENKIMESGR